jgi:pimeloyl-ACP methyl ester carboxylesterase
MKTQTATKKKDTDFHATPSGKSLIPVKKKIASEEKKVPFSPFGVWGDLLEYQIDALQRGVLFWDTLRQRSNNMLDHEKAGMPPPLAFKYETIMDARTFKRPSNYALLKILETDDACLEDCLDPAKPPVIVVDPRAGHGPGIGGFKRDSEVGIALHEGHPVYFVMFYPDPEPHQTIADILESMKIFVGKASSLHGGKKPILYGNCQAGWLITLLSAHCKGTTPGLSVLNGSPLSYWASGDKGGSAMQIRGSLSGGVWLTRFMADLGGGILNGAWLVQNFETLAPAQAVWGKLYNLYEHTDTEQDRFLDFELWWNGFYRFSEEEITKTVESLFIGNKLERGGMVLDDDCHVDLKDIKNPMLIFASEGDDLTPPRQALHWIRAVYSDTKALKAAGQRIVYMINKHVGHLGIFVSAKVARLEHRAILEQASHISVLEPGLYEMIIDNPTDDPDCSHDQYKVSFEERKIEDLCDIAPQAPFEAVRKVSERNDQLYRTFFRPWVQAFAKFQNGDMIRQLHPLRLKRIMFSERLNPAMLPLIFMAKSVQENRHKASEDNPYIKMEQQAAERMIAVVESKTALRDEQDEKMFKAFYGE